MIDLGHIRPGRTIRIPFNTFDKDDGSSITMTNYAVTDILIYKDGSTTERASTSGFTATTDFDTKTGKHLAVIDLADNTTAGFFACGSEYLVAIDAITADGVTSGGWIARFRIGYPDAVLNTTIASLSSQTSFTLTEGPAEDDALNDMWVVIHDVASAVQWGRAIIADYTGSTKTVTLAAGTTFTAAATDNISVMGPAPLRPTVAGRTLDVSTGGEAGIDWANVGSPTTAVNLSATTFNLVNTATTLTNLPAITSNWLTATGLDTTAVEELRNAITGGAYALDTDANGRPRFADGTGAGELDTSSGHVTLADASLTTAKLGAFELAKTTNITGFNDLSAAQVNTEVDTALADIHLDHLLAADYDPASKPGVATALLNELIESDAGVSRFTANALEQAPSGGGGGGDATEANQTTIIGHLTDIKGATWASTDSLEAIRDRGDAAWTTATGFSTHSAADVWSAGTRTLTALGFTLAASDLASGIITSAKFAAGAIDAAATSADFITEIRNAITGGAYALDTDANGRIRNVVGTAAGELNLASGNVELADGSLVTAKLGTFVLAKTTNITGFNDLSASAVNAEVVDAIATDTYGEPSQGAPGVTLSLADKIGYLFTGFRNRKTQTSTEQTTYADDGTTALFKANVSDDGTTCEVGELVTGA